MESWIVLILIIISLYVAFKVAKMVFLLLFVVVLAGVISIGYFDMETPIEPLNNFSKEIMGFFKDSEIIDIDEVKNSISDNAEDFKDKLQKMSEAK